MKRRTQRKHVFSAVLITGVCVDLEHFRLEPADVASAVRPAAKARRGINPVLTCRKQIRRARRQADCIGGHRTPPMPPAQRSENYIERTNLSSVHPNDKLA